MVAGPGSVGSEGKGVSAHCAIFSLNCIIGVLDCTYRLFNVGNGQSGGEVSLALRWRGNRHLCNGESVVSSPCRERILGGSTYDFSAVDEVVDVLAEDRQVVEHELEHLLRLRLVVHERLPLARRARVTRDRVVRLKPELALDRGLDLALVSARAGEERAAELGLEEELRVEETRGRVER